MSWQLANSVRELVGYTAPRTRDLEGEMAARKKARRKKATTRKKAVAKQTSRRKQTTRKPQRVAQEHADRVVTNTITDALARRRQRLLHH